jgi:hypothetical protein
MKVGNTHHAPITSTRHDPTKQPVNREFSTQREEPMTRRRRLLIQGAALLGMGAALLTSPRTASAALFPDYCDGSWDCVLDCPAYLDLVCRSCTAQPSCTPNFNLCPQPYQAVNCNFETRPGGD